ncbi:hypothetical protein SAMN06297229_0783 [Pseudidiomarina planktonica]|uniref:Uncharacterized protein n=1 Tax=Pseudidiomarina planktonica TaxID=1323738 RepID=A0A1Y6ERW4_9GAMM|nr:hypothetical protein [Pseudidiomarina planktonica]RUO65766.1 hypothetical protein CWI77_04845 [Pseudidiomarina planktonica]SMQ62943.1 hypothetical protein SAMN06297229_0783 [Pseudidiomarina planktonica]
MAQITCSVIHSRLVPAVSAAMTALLLLGCSPQQSSESSVAAGAENRVAELDLQILPNQQWQLSRESIQLSFCRNRTNEALLADSAELRLWRLSGEITAFPDYRAEGLEALQRLFAEHDVMLWQESGTVSSQLYRLVSPEGAKQRSLFAAIASLNRDSRLCYVAVKGIA